jgi:hypothetical protein
LNNLIPSVPLLNAEEKKGQESNVPPENVEEPHGAAVAGV